MSITPFFHVYHKYVFNMANKGYRGSKDHL